MIDTHAHLYAKEFQDDLSQTIQRAKEVGVTKILLPNIDLDSLPAMDKLVEQEAELFYKMYGLHPCSVDATFSETLDKLEDYITKKDFIAIGEIGIDLYWDKTYAKEQEAAFLRQCGWANNLNMPIVIHSRESTDIIIDLIQQHYPNKLSGVFHCFSGTADQGNKIIDMGYYLGIGGVVTFKNSTLREVLSSIPLDKLVLETDSPYLAPVPYRGKRNESSYVIEVAKQLSYVYDVSISEVISITTSNALKLFNL